MYILIRYAYMHWTLDATRKTVFIWRRAAAYAFVWPNFRKTLVWFLRTLKQWHMQAKLAGETFAIFSLPHSISLSPSPCVRTCVHLFVCNWICAHIISMPNINTLQFVEFIFMGYEPIPCNIPRANYVAAYIMCIVSLCCMLNSRSTNCSLVCNIQYLQSGYEHIAFFCSLSK